jgi:hypothetical protein
MFAASCGLPANIRVRAATDATTIVPSAFSFALPPNGEIHPDAPQPVAHHAFWARAALFDAERGVQ